ncbi:transformation/transcription domain-associated protein isoform X1 [Maylandia zebra]|uniref:Transformation/transcription domain-associated protein isoform X1 n=1 Tax=Pundamilia nyererei TaxID=303518 RepID=A0A9Y3QPL9_9CICH|nr:transformation/transcription domain-associated protein isoform X1 [Maylandia zebra]XP_005721765.1 PREDICTED: transformation/transcription domain-associated protein isoform X1 [Pundamilia nyererei]XP_026034794.1 transformation/transcription domain-associated protein isoform X1 [Astatotilapia calliptera]XP_026034795.1 transformation/transcription domain-associated protein isoform X1 [Astatotilapia calliptera]XP_042081109.1 transformation/transcription domain-associated protein isoform X1 [Hapl
MAFVPAPSPTVVDQTTLMKKYLQFVAALTDANTPDETKLKMMQEVSENFENVTSSPQYSTFLEHIIPRFLTFLQDGEVQFLQEKPTQQLRKLVLEIIHRIPTNEHLRPHTKNILSVMFRFLEIESEENVLICLRIIIELHKQFRPPISQEIHHFLDFVKQIYKDLPKVVARYFENPQVIAENTVPSPEMVGMITSVLVKTAPEREDSETRTHTIIPRGSLSLKVLAELPIIVVLMYQLYKLNIHNVVSEFVPLIMNTIMLQVSPQARQHKLYNKELYADFIAAQIKTLSFLAYIIRIYQDLVAKYSQQMVKGMLQLLTNCPSETAHLRKELLIAAKHILTTDLRSQFIPCMDKLFDESILIGSGYTARETLRPLAYSTLADLVHHVRQNLTLTDLSLAVQLFAKNIDDESLPSNIQTMSCKLLLNLVDCIRSKSEQENGNGRDILMRMLEVFVLKFHTIARYQLVSIFKKCKPQSEMGVVDPGAIPAVPATPTPSTTPAIPPPAPPTPVTVTPQPPATPFDRGGEKEDKQTFQVSDCRSLVKTLVCGVKTITWGITSCKAPGEAQFIPNKQLQPKETQIYIKLVKYAMQALDIYQVQVANNQQTYIRVANCQTVRMKEEKEVLEHFAGVFTMMNPLTFKEIFQTTVPYMVERISKNYALQIVANSFLANISTSALFATILVEYLLERLPEMGSNVELSNLYLKLFKLVFGSVSLFAAENEQMLKPHLHKIVNSSMELAQSAKEPYNYFLLLRALFRSIGGGSHDLLYQEFLPLLPNLLQGLNMLQSGLHKQHMKDLFVELCLTVPVRLSSLLPYLPMLMDPLVSALNGSQTLVSQGLRTLELCVDNLQPDFLYDHIQPVRAELMQALWRTLRNPAESISHVAYRVLGKFGGSNRKMLKESQRLHYVVTEVQGPSIKAEFTDCKASIQLPMEKAIETALDCLKSANTEPYYRRQAWEVIKCFLVAMTSLDDNKHSLYQLLSHPNFTEKWIPSVIISHRYKAQDTPARRTFEQALTGAFMSAVIKDLRPSALPFVASLIRHYTMVAVAQQCGPFLLPCYQLGSQPSTAMFHSEENGSQGMDPLVLIDAIAICMAYEEKELCKIGEVALAVIFDVASIILGSKERACQLPLFSYIVERLCACCYEQAWYAKLGGVVSIKFLMERLPLIWVLQNQLTFLKALLFVMMDLTGEVSNGAVAMAKTTLEQLLVRCATPLKDEEKTEELLAAQDKSFHMVTHDLVREVTSPNSTVRKQAMHSLQVLAQVTGKSVTVIMEPHKEVLQDMVPPKKHLLRHQPANAQIGLMEGNTFCTTLQPRLFTMDLNVMEHKVFYTELLNLCEAEDAALMKLPCYKSLPSLVPLRIAALNALAACNYLPQSREKIIAALFKALNSTNNELQEAGEGCMRKFLEGATIEVDQIHTHMRPLLMMLGDYRSLTLNVVNRLTSVTRLFPNSFNDKFCDQMMQHLRKWMEVVVITHKGGQRSDGSPALEGVEEMKICSAIINLFHLIPAAPQTLVKPLLEVVMKTERAMLIEAGSPFREPLIKFLTRHPSQTVELFMMEATLNDPQWSRMFMSFLKHKDAKPLRDVLASNPNRFVPLLVSAGTAATVRPGSPSTATARLDLQFQAIKIISIIVKNDEGWLAGQHSLVSQLRRVWVSEAFQERHRKDNMAATNWKEPKLLAYCLLSYCKRNYSEIELLFQLLRAFTGRFLCNMTFLKEYMEEEIPKNYSIPQKRALFFRFVEFNDPHFNDELKAKVLQHILNPAFLYSFEKGEGEQLLGPPNPEGDNPESITSVFITKVLDPEKQADLLDSLRICLLQFSTLLVEHAPHHIHDNNKSRNSKLRRLMTFAWPCLLPKACVDPACKYSGHLLLAHIIAKFAIHKKIVLQVFHSLLKAHTMEARAIVRQAMAILTPAVPARMEDGHQMLTHWTRKIIVEEGHTVPQLVHILHLIVQHFRVYYPVRHHLVQHMISAMQRLGFTPSVTIEQRKLAVDLAEVVIKWELQRIKDQQPESEAEVGPGGEGTSGAAVKRGLSLESAGAGQDVKRFRTATGAASTVFGRSQSMPGTESMHNKPVEKQHTDTVVNFLIRIACQVNDSTNVAGSPGELLSRRCVSLMKTALRPDMWPRAELKLQWFDKLLMTVEQPAQANISNICTGLEILCFLLTVLQPPAVLAHFKPLQRGIAACMTCGNTKVLRAVHSLLSRLMSIFPTEPSTSNVASKYEELECLYAAVGKVIYEGLTNYEKATTNTNPTQLFGTLMILKSACSYNASYIDRLISVFMRSLQKMVREHLSPQQANPGVTETSTVTSELIMLSLDLVKTRLSVMSMEMRKNFIQVILTSLIEKSPDPKILRAVVKIVEEWVKNNSPMAANQMPNLREKSILLVKMMTYIEKRFPDELELNAQFLDLVNYVYRDESLSGSDITSKLEPAFLSGLRCSQPMIRAKFFEVFDASMKRRVYERLLYICCSQNWEAMGSHFWIKQCIELLLAVCERNTIIGTSCQGSMLPSITNVINLADSHDRAAFAMATHVKQEPRERENTETKEEDVEIDIELAPGDQTAIPKTKEQAERDTGNQLHMLTNRHDKFLDSLREVKTGALLNALVQLCHISTPLAERTWVQLFPRLWKILSDRQQHALSGEMSPFLCSGSHQAQRDCQPSALNCFVEAMSQCVPPIPIRPCVLKYLGKTHNLWLRSTLMLEQQAFEKGLSLHSKPKQSTEFYEQESITPPQQEILDSLAELYSLLQEEDMWAGLWQKRCKFPETATAIAYEQHGFFEQAQESYEKAMEKARKEHERSNVSPAVFPEYQLWEDHWIRCSKELNQWEPLTEYGQSKGHSNPYLVLECAWRVSNWAAMKEALVQVELSCPKEMAWKVNMHRGYLAICNPEEQQLNFIERLVEMASSLAIREWRRLPHIVSHVHTPLLQAAQQIIELQEAAQINAGLQTANLGRNTSLHDMKTVVKTWRNRLPIVSDDLSHWSSIFMWRQHHYQAIVTAYETNTQHDPNNNNAMLGVHASASAIIQYGKIARKQGLVNVALDILSRIHTIPTVPIVDCFQKIRQQVKCYLQLAGVMGKNECMQGLEVIESTNLKYFTKEMTAEFYALKGMFLAQINKSEEANKAFSAAVQMHDVLVKAWAMWGDYLENIFVKDRQLHLGVSAITCYLHACRHQNESKSRKYLAKVLWLLSFDDKNTLADAVDKYCIGVPPIQWLAWIPQLLTCLVGSEGKPLLNLISQVGRVYPQAVYFPIRTLYLTLKIEQRERYKSDSSGQQQPSSIGAQPHSGASDPGPIRATAPMWRCSRIMHMQRELHPTLLSSLEGIVDQMVWFRENWHEEVLRQLQQGLAKCYSVAFEKSGAVSDAKITPHTLNFVKKLVSTFGVGLENVSNVSNMFSSAASESLARRAQATAQDPVFQKMKGQFTTDFDFSVPGSMKLHNLISKLKKWIKILEAKTKQLPKFFLIEEKCRFLSNFSAQTAEVEIPGEFLMPKPTHYYIKIARFMPRVEIVQKHNTAARRLYIRGHNGKIYPYLVMNDACLTESRREERVLQLLRLLNPCLEKRKETTKRHLFFTVPRVVAVSPQMRLVEDNPSSLSLVEIYKQRCAKKGIEHDNPISRYYDRLATVQARGTQASHQVLRDILKEVQGNMVPRSMLKEWALHTFPNATDYWTFRKMFTIQLALIGLAEFMLHLNRLNPEMLQIAQDTGKLNVSYFRFDINDATGDLDANRPVPFRLTPNISEFLTTIGVSGPLTASMIAVARCFAQPNFKVDGILKAVLRDEIIAWHKKTQEDTSIPLSPAGQPENMDSQQLVSLVQKAVTAIMTRLHNLAQFEGGESKVNTLVAAANSLDNLCRMDPAWHPWL